MHEIIIIIIIIIIIVIIIIIISPVQLESESLVQSVTNPAFRDPIENQANVCVFAVGFDRTLF